MTSATSGPLLGAFLLALLVPVANWKGTAAGMILSHIITLYITFGHLMLDKSPEFLETSIAACSNETFSNGIVKPATDMTFNLPHNIDVSNFKKSALMNLANDDDNNSDSYGFPQNIYAISYMYYSLIGTLITVIVGILVSYLTRTKNDAYDSKLLHPFVYKMYSMLPGTDKYFTDKSDKKDSLSNVNITEQFNKGFESKNGSSFNIYSIDETINSDRNEKYTKIGIGSNH